MGGWAAGGYSVARPLRSGCTVSDIATVEEAASRREALVLSTLLLFAGLLVGLSPLVGIVRTADSAPTSAAVPAAFVAVLPGVLAIVLALRRPILGLAATAGAGVIGVVRLLADLAVLLEPDRITRPELFAETTERARPFAPAAGAWLLVGADLLWLVVGLLAAVKLIRIIPSNSDPRGEVIFGGPAADPDALDELDVGDGSEGSAAVAPALGGRETGRRPINLVMVSVGFLGAVLLMVGALGTPFEGGYLALRILPFGSSLTGLVAAALLGFLAALVVLVAAALPRMVARALLAGTALAAAVPGLTAVVAVLAGAPTGLSPVVWCGLAGAVVLAASGMLVRGAAAGVATESDDVVSGRWLQIGAGLLAVLSAAALAGASRASLLYLDGAPPDQVAGVALAPTASPQLVAAIPLAVAGVLALIGGTAAIGRAAVTVLWAGALYAFGQGMWARSLVLATAGDSSTSGHTWSAGPGQWLLWLGTVSAIAAAVTAGLAARRVAQASLDVIDDGSLAASRGPRLWLAGGLTVLIVVALTVPVYSTLAGSAAGLFHGYDLDTWGFWALAVGAVGAVWAGALTRRRAVAATYPVAAAVLLGQPLVVPEVIRAAPGFSWSAGFWFGIATVILLLAAAPFFAMLAARVRRIDLPPLTGSLDRPGEPVPARSKGS